jgi:tyrosinase
MANGGVVRPSAEHANVAALEDAYQKMQAISAADNRSWSYWAEFHGFNRYECWHHARVASDMFPYDLFLPWHRAYLAFFDNAARDQNPDAILPWWDWTSDASHQSGLPAAYAFGGASLQSGPVPSVNGNPERRSRRNPSNPGILPTAQEVDDILKLTDFRDFSNQLQDIHDGIHGWVGGDMGSIGTSAFDPVFWAHHAMIDRLWYLWQLRHGVNNIPPEYLDKALFPGYTVQQVLDIRTLGYDFAVATVAGGTDVPAGVPGSDVAGVPAAEGGREAPPDGEAGTPPTTAVHFGAAQRRRARSKSVSRRHRVPQRRPRWRVVRGTRIPEQPGRRREHWLRRPELRRLVPHLRARGLPRRPRSLRGQAAPRVRSPPGAPTYSGEEGGDRDRGG